MTDEKTPDGPGSDIVGILPFLGVLGDSSELRVLHELLNFPDQELTIGELVEYSERTQPMVSQAVDKFNEWNIVKVRKIGTSRLVKLNLDSQIVESAIVLLASILGRNRNSYTVYNDTLVDIILNKPEILMKFGIYFNTNPIQAEDDSCILKFDVRQGDTNVV